MKQIKLRLLPSEGIRYDSKSSTVVIIDVFRATTTIPILLNNGAFKVVPTNDIEYALNSNFVKIGERSSLKIQGFDYNNSPTQLFKVDFSGQNVILTTSNGTKAVQIYTSFDEVITLSFVNFNAVREYLLNKENVILVCSGSHGEFSLEDFVCAKLMMDSLPHVSKLDTYMLSKLLKVDFTNYKDVCINSHHAENLIKKGFGEDVEFCLRMNEMNLVPIYKDGGFVKLNG